ncbi:uncharacterized protein LOC122871972 isoform X5 [Siniperca chuatsi]|uniref:uncharacterized protein LOC122871972 isoform X5 n=1 Tax=Siniperca chuatsi TaxID=119488 RepID=UPI001CE0B5AD|nr:uncharacterized protein LOC122871972 isoform X5 [Siniperca chuatsi]
MSGGAGRCADLRLEGAKTEEVAPMNGPTVNLHLLTVSHADTERDSENRGLPGGDREGGRLHRCGDVQDYTGQLFNMAAITEEGNINTCRYHEGSQLTHTNASTIIHIEDRTQILETSRQPSTTLNLRLLMNRPRPRAPFTFSLGAFISSLWVLDFKIHSVRIEPTTSEPPRSPLPPGDTEPGRNVSSAPGAGDEQDSNPDRWTWFLGVFHSFLSTAAFKMNCVKWIEPRALRRPNSFLTL